jgi:wyosine [tRNA(Phe)-imidazoG37] synthetase (radical SAM superfamily)
MAFLPVFHDIFDSLRFGRILLVEISPPPPAGRPCRFCDVLSAAARVPGRSHFSVPDSAAKVIVAQLERGAAVDAVVFGGGGEPLRHGGIGSILRKIRIASHVATVVLTNGVLLQDRAVRREASEADTIVAWLPALEDASDPGSPIARREAFERHVEGMAALRRESQVHIGLELPVRPGENDRSASLGAWKRAVDRIRPDRVFVIPAPGAPEENLPDALERVREFVHPGAGAFLFDSTPADRRCFCSSDTSG